MASLLLTSLLPHLSFLFFPSSLASLPLPTFSHHPPSPPSSLSLPGWSCVHLWYTGRAHPNHESTAQHRGSHCHGDGSRTTLLHLQGKVGLHHTITYHSHIHQTFYFKANSSSRLPSFLPSYPSTLPPSLPPSLTGLQCSPSQFYVRKEWWSLQSRDRTVPTRKLSRG